ncbi:hypothetical protein Tco_1420009 [Tanacetum coccineum]
MNRWVRKEFKTYNDEAQLSIQHWKDTWHKRMYKINHKKVRDDPKEYFFDHKIVKVIRVSTEQQHGLDFMEQIIMMRENDKPNIFSEAGFKYLKKSYIEDIYQIKINLTTPMLIFSGIKACDPYSIVDEPTLGLIYLNCKEEKRVMDLVKIVKFYDATLEMFLKEVKLKIFETMFIKKVPLLGDLDLKIMKAYEREITKLLRHREQMRLYVPWEVMADLFQNYYVVEKAL